MITVPLGRIGMSAGPGTGPVHRLFAYPDGRTVFVVTGRTSGGWRGTVLARRHPSRSPRQIFVADRDLLLARTALTVDPARDPDEFAMVWEARTKARWPSGHMPSLAQHLSTEIRAANGVDLEGDPLCRATACVARTSMAGLHILISRLEMAGYLLCYPADDGPVRRTLNLPHQDARPDGGWAINDQVTGRRWWRDLAEAPG